MSSAIADQGSLFSRFYISMVRAAEASGDIGKGLDRLIDYLDRRQEVHDRIVSALIYPAILLTIAGLSLVILLTYVVPQFRSMFDEMGPALPLATRIVLAISDFVASFGWLGIPLAAIGVVAVRSYCGKQENRLRIDSWLLRLPLAGSIVRDLETARLTRSLGTLLQNGVPVLQSLSIARDSIGNRVMTNEIDKAITSLTEGGRLGGTLLHARVFPKLAIQLIQVGEETGSLGRTMLHIASIYDREVKKKIQRLLAMVEPVMIIGLGIIIAGIVMSILVGIVSINDLPL
jgi:general secretion pathway protein F